MVKDKSDSLDPDALKNIVRKEIGRRKFKLREDIYEPSFTLALALSAAVKKIFYTKSRTIFSAEPVVDKKLIIQFAHRMRVDAMEKFNATTIFATIYFGQDDSALEREEYSGAMVVYLEKKFLPEFLRLLKYPYIDYDDDEESRDGCGAVANLIAGQYKKEIKSLGYQDLAMSHFSSYINTTPDGIAIPSGLTHKYEISFEIEGVKRLVVEMGMYPLPHKAQ